MKIFPANISNAICPSCGINKCDPNLTYVQTMYRITDVAGKTITYITTDVDVPKCRDCKHNFQSAIVFPIILLLILTVILLYGFANGGLSFSSFLWREVLAIIVSAISWGFSILGVRVVYKTHSVGEYKPIQIMEKYGWQRSKPQKTAEFKSAYTNIDHYNMLMEIAQEGEYTVN